MFAVYKYNLFKYAKAPSTWVILLISCFIASFLGGFLPYSSINTESDWAAKTYSQTVVAIVAGMTTFLSLFVSVFAGFKAAAMFKDEVEDGTFLVTLSKPIARRTIIFGKWLALQTALISFTFISSFVFGLFTYIFDCGNKITGLDNFGTTPIAERVVEVTLFLWAIITLMGLIFSSIALLLSTWLSVGTTIGISIAIGVVIPVTSLLATFTKKEEYTGIQTPWGLITHNRFIRFFQTANSYGLHIDNSKLSGLLNDVDKDIQDPLSLYNLGIATGETDGFKSAWPFDFDFQIHKLAEYASEQVVPEVVKNDIMAGSKGVGSFGAEGVSNKLDKRNPLSKEITDKNADYNYIFDRFAKELPKLWELEREEIRYVWKVAEKLLDESSKLVSLPETYLVKKEIANSIINTFIVKHDSVNNTTEDFDDINVLRQKLAKDHEVISNTRTALGYKLNDPIFTLPSTPANDAIIKSQWWVNWYKLSKELNESRNWNSTATNVDANAKYATWISAMRSLFGESGKLGTNELSLNDYNGYVFNGTDSHIRRAFKAATWVLSNSWSAQLKKENQYSAANAVSEIGSVIEMATRPINVLYFDTNISAYGSFKNLMERNNIEPLPYTDVVAAEIATKLHGYNFSNLDTISLHAILGTALARPDLLVKIEAKDYVKKYSILLIYLFIAAILVPISYWIVRRKDFR